MSSVSEAITMFCMNRTLISEAIGKVGETIKLSGWLYKQRELGGLSFVILRDRSGLIQILAQEGDELEKVKSIQNGSVLEIEGKVVADKRAPNGVEIREPKINVMVPVTFVAPIEIDKEIDHNPENFNTLFENRVLSLRNITEQKIFKVQAAVGKAIRDFFEENGFIEIHTPKLLAESTEGGAEVFKTDYFGKLATLAQSPQFYKEMMVGAFERVYEIGPVYRAEPSMTTRHMSEYVSVDAEMGFISGLNDLIVLLSDLTNQVCNTAWEKCGSDLRELKAEKPVLTRVFPQITMKDLHELYYKETGKDLRKEKDPAPEEERFISEYSLKKWKSEAVFVTEFPSSAMKFYHLRSEADQNVAERADLIFRGVEIVTTSMREHRFEKLIEQLKAVGGNPESTGYKYFLQAFKFGMPSLGGFGLGLERLTQRIIGLSSIKEATLFPRDVNRLSP